MKKTEKSNTNEIIEIPAEEAPYALPDGWKWVRVKHLCKLYRGVSYKKDDAHSEKLANDVLILRGGNIGEGYININTDNVYIDRSLIDETQLIKKNDIVIVGSTGSKTVIGRAGVSYCDYEDVAFGAFLILVRPSITDCYPKYLDYFFQSDNYRHRIRTLASGVNINNIRAEHINETVVPLPPLETQQRIVDRIESLFAKLDEAKEKAQTALDGFELRKSAILHKAFTGELTAKWREEHGIWLDSWVEAPLGDYSTSQYGYTEKSSVEEIGPHFLRITDIQDGKVLWNEVPYCKIDDETKEKYVLSIGDIVVARTGATTGKSYMVMDAVDSVFASYLIRVSISKKELLAPEYLYLFMQSPKYWGQIMELSQGIAQPGVNGKKLQTLTLPVPSMEEQLKIVELANGIMPRMDQAKEAAEAVIEKIDLMKKSILARAFRGEL